MLVRPPALRWTDPAGFLLAALGSALGIDALATVPYLALAHGGGAFLLAYLILVAGAVLPLMILEIGVGVCFQASAPGGLRRLNRRLQWIGWWTTVLALTVGILVAIQGARGLILGGHAVVALVGDVSGSWDDPLPEGSWWWERGAESGTLLPASGVILALLTLWLVTARILVRGMPEIGRWCTVFIPLALALLVGIGVAFLYQPGAVDGVARYLVPRWSALLDLGTWTAAARAAFLTQAMGLGIYIAYASHLERGSDSAGHALLISLAGAGFTFLAGFVGCAAMGMLAVAEGRPILAGVREGPHAALDLLTQAVDILPLPAWGSAIMGLLLAALWVLLALTSVLGLMAAVIVAYTDAFPLSWERAVHRILPVAGVVSLVLCLPAFDGLIVRFERDLFVGAVAIAAAAQGLTLIAVGSGGNLQRHINAYSAVRVGWSWRITVMILVPLVLCGVSVVGLTQGSGLGFWALGLSLAGAISFAVGGGLRRRIL